MPKSSAFTPVRQADCMMLELNPPSSLDSIHPELATMLKNLGLPLVFAATDHPY